MARRLAAAAAFAALLLARPAAAVLPAQPDYLRMGEAAAAAAYQTTFAEGPGPGELTLTNGLVTRTFLLRGGAMATASLRLEAGDGTDFVRALAPEARVFVNGDSAFGIDVGGFLNQSQFLVYYADETALVANPLAMVVLNYSASAVVMPYAYAPRWGVPAEAWPPKGVHLAVDFGMPPLTPGDSGFFPLAATELACDGSGKYLGCLVGHPACDNSSVPQQCSLPRATAVATCAAWPACMGVTCSASRTDCQARGSITQLPGAPLYSSFVKGGDWFAPDLRVTVHTQMYDGIPALSRWLTVGVAPGSAAPAPVVSQCSMELLHVFWNLRARLHAETAYMPSLGIENSFEGAGYYPKGYPANFSSLVSAPVNLWVFDEQLSGPFGDGGINKEMQDFVAVGMNETMLDVSYPFGPGLNLSGAPLETFRVHMILHEDEVLDRQALARKRMLRTVAPQVGMDLLPKLLVEADSTSVRAGADMAAAAGFRSLHMKDPGIDLAPEHVALVAADVAYVHSKGLGCSFYICLQQPPNMTAADHVIDPDTGEAQGIACFATAFHRAFRAKIEAFVQATGFDFIDTDCPYEHSACASTEHEHAGLVDSQYAQFTANVGWYASLPTAPNNLSLTGSGIIVSCPDPYELSAGTWDQPIGFTAAWNHDITEPWTWLLMGRTYAHDGTFWKPTTNGFFGFDLARAGNMSTPDELQFLDTGLATFVGVAGRNFDSGALWLNDASKAIFLRWMALLDTYRALLNGDVVHVRKPSGTSWDAMMHVLPSAAAGEPRAFAIFFNPLATRAASVNTSLCVYYANFPSGPAPVRVEWSNGEVEQATQDAAFSVRLSRVIPPRGYDFAVLS